MRKSGDRSSAFALAFTFRGGRRSLHADLDFLSAVACRGMRHAVAAIFFFILASHLSRCFRSRRRHRWNRRQGDRRKRLPCQQWRQSWLHRSLRPMAASNSRPEPRAASSSWSTAKSFRQLQTPDFYAGQFDSIERNLVLEPAWVRESIVVTATGVPTPQPQTSEATTVLSTRSCAP